MNVLCGVEGGEMEGDHAVPTQYLPIIDSKYDPKSTDNTLLKGGIVAYECAVI